MPDDRIQLLSISQRACTSYNQDYDQAAVPVLLDLGARLINSTGAAYLLTLAGYWATSAHCIRDLTELGQLLEFFRHQPAEITRWGAATGADRYKAFSFGKVHQLMRDVESKNAFWKQWFDDFSDRIAPKRRRLCVPLERRSKAHRANRRFKAVQELCAGYRLFDVYCDGPVVRTLDSVMTPDRALPVRFPVEFAAFGSGAVFFNELTRDQIVEAWR